MSDCDGRKPKGGIHGFRKLWNAEDDGFTTEKEADIMRHGQGTVMFLAWRSMPFAAENRKGLDEACSK